MDKAKMNVKVSKFLKRNWWYVGAFGGAGAFLIGTMLLRVVKERYQPDATFSDLFAHPSVVLIMACAGLLFGGTAILCQDLWRDAMKLGGLQRARKTCTWSWGIAAGSTVAASILNVPALVSVFETLFAISLIASVGVTGTTLAAHFKLGQMRR
ncbi:hypothetical protein D2T29_12805 [Sinirhodobacter populi]|uniref:Uncharacterized protein n=1 Tax=Paenirhodobacter populi TaxID=2306993 RepID=A0A443KCT4_9RHOB|nr:hypothetical protein [Sinirhodobacter populi]RWR30545.1 hypothetical protein D2T29_12805 [Sinirhodobacter populi]